MAVPFVDFYEHTLDRTFLEVMMSAPRRFPTPRQHLNRVAALGLRRRWLQGKEMINPI